MRYSFELKAPAKKALFHIADFVESQNTPGSGTRFITSFLDTIETYTVAYTGMNWCNYPAFAQRKYKCVVIEQWVITLRMENNILYVYHIIHGSRLNY